MNISNPRLVSDGSEGKNTSSQGQEWIGWVPLILLPASALGVRNIVTAWEFMWILAFSVFAALKWLTWWKVRGIVRHPAWRSAAYLLAWPGMDAESFLDPTIRARSNPGRAWLWATLDSLLGATCIWLLARRIPPSSALLRGWIGMLGLILLLHFGSFRIMALTWQSLGVAAVPIMNAPLRATSLSEFWGKRWNLGFRQLAHDLIFRPLYKRFGTGIAGFLVFVASGLLHDLVISVPARGGYGLPTLYFALQGIGVAVERSSIGKRFGLGHAARGWFFMAVITAAPAFWLFHPIFVRNVILPFIQAIGAL